ncbi:MAG: phosphoenolpyruvate-utilizing N-terminal domain-containing protein, partial [Gemmatimonadaceae bacterium]
MPRAILGLPASPGIVVGPVHLLRWELPQVRQRIIADDRVASEIERFESVVARATSRLTQVRERVAAHTGEEEAAIFDVQIAMLADIELLDNVRALIHQNLAAEKAFDLVMADWQQSFARHTHAMLRERVADLADVHIRVLSMLLELDDHDPVDVPKGSNAILVTHDLTPSLTVQL